MIDGASFAPDGRADVAGTIEVLREVETPYGRNWKMNVVLENGSRVRCSVPARANARVGDQIRFRATFRRNGRDPRFADGYRPMLLNKQVPSRMEAAVCQPA